MHLGILSAGIENGGIDPDLQGHVAISTKKRHSTLLLYTDLGRPRGITNPKHALVLLYFAWWYDFKTE